MAGGTLLVQAAATTVAAGLSTGAGRLAEELGQVTAADYAADLAQLIVLTNWVILKEDNDRDIADRIRRDHVDLLLRDHRAKQQSIGETAGRSAHGIGRKVELLKRTSDEIREMIDHHKE